MYILHPSPQDVIIIVSNHTKIHVAKDFAFNNSLCKVTSRA